MENLAMEIFSLQQKKVFKEYPFDSPCIDTCFGIDAEVESDEHANILADTDNLVVNLGAIEVDPAIKTHWTLYQKSLVPLSRWVDGNLRLFYRKFEEEQGADVKDTGTAKELERLGFQVSWEDIGARRSVLDSYQSFEHAKRLSELQRYILEHLTRVADEILLRISIVQPELKDELHAAFQTFESIETSANVAQVALSCRRFLERLANGLYPPRKELVNGKEVGPKQYRNRLWAYAEEKLGDTEGKAFLSQLDDIGKRIDRLDDLVNKGVHDRIMPSDLHRLIVGLLVVAYDLLALSVPPLIASNIPYAESITAFAKKVASNPLSTNEDPNKWTN